jgi:general secretion pathway protein G
MVSRANGTARRASGFTLIELLVAVAIIGLLAAIAMVAFGAALDRAKQRATMADMRTLARALEAYDVDHGRFPDDSGGVTALEPLLIPYQVNVVPTHDSWGWAYSYDAVLNSYTLESFGKDGVDGTDVSKATRDVFEHDIVLADGRFVASPE